MPAVLCECGPQDPAPRGMPAGRLVPWIDLRMSVRPSTVEAALEHFIQRREGGEALDSKVFAAAYPELQPELGAALEGLLALERATTPAPGSATGLPGRIGPYRILREIGRGGMGVVLEAIEEPLGRQVALKVLPPELLESASARARFDREAGLAARLDHPGIATVYGAGLAGIHPWIAMRFVKGETLARAITQARAGHESCVHLPPAKARGREAALALAACMAKVARALQDAHEHGVVHRDVKPSNIIITPGADPVLLDFGLAIDEQHDAHALTRTGERAGTPAYLAPESVSGELARPDAQCDVYALGVTLYECLALRRPFDAPTAAALYHSILNESVADLRAHNRGLPRDLAVVVATAMERDRARRYGSAAALAEDLEACVAGRPIAARAVPLHGRVLRWVRREPRLAATSGAAIALAMGGLAWVSWVQHAAEREMEQQNKVLSATNISLELAKAQAELNEREARQKAADVLSLSAIQDLQQLLDRADLLWPAGPAMIPRYEEWLRDAHTLVDGRPAIPAQGIKARPGLAEHERKLAEIESRALPRGTPEADWDFPDGEDRWWHVQLAKLIADLRGFTDPAGGLCSSGISPQHGWGIERRLAFARTLEQRSLGSAEAVQRWDEAIAAIRDPARCPAYAGLVLAPQLGLLPLGRDPVSGLHEFANLWSGEPARRDANGKLVLEESTGIVLVLVPGGKCAMGAQAADPAAPNFDPLAAAEESPVHEVTLAPFFLSKFEMTQGQWLRITGSNPSQYQPGETLGGKSCTLLCPVELVSWEEGSETLRRLGLVLPNEAQWEYAARAGTRTPWSTGAKRETLAGAANLADAFYEHNGGPASWTYENWLEDGWSLHAPVGSYLPNAFGLHDTLGNVWEWCRDTFASYDAAQIVEEGGREISEHRVCRGGAFSLGASDARCSVRFHGPASARNYDLGLRPALELARAGATGK